jgi:hypothetical protein
MAARLDHLGASGRKAIGLDTVFRNGLAFGRGRRFYNGAQITAAFPFRANSD